MRISFDGVLTRSIRSVSLSVFALMMTLSNPVAGQDLKAPEIIDLNRRIMHQQIIERDPALFDETSLDEFLVARSLTPCFQMAIEHGFC